VILPKSVREAGQWAPGTEFEVTARDGGVFLEPKPVRKRYTLDDLIGCLPYEGPPKTLEDMQRGIDQAMAERWERKKG
jgi:bifunctional DNA-binding transcriptional regulator/antitoxin component of YhaV-PrlF toxin-antitoxin module